MLCLSGQPVTGRREVFFLSYLIRLYTHQNIQSMDKTTSFSSCSVLVVFMIPHSLSQAAIRKTRIISMKTVPFLQDKKKHQS